jgi:hypothetical protein
MERDPEVNLATALAEVQREAAGYLSDRGHVVRTEGESFVTVCCNCRKVRDDLGSWHDMEEYFSRQAGVEISHGLCAECAQGLFPDSVAGEGAANHE